ncbi:MAG TPA: methyltransferase domain-containing protein [Candidatus Binatia bacterium]|nr:methyltransferase domain-containing protein [Candidatus Binatia bacterium]
MAGDAWDPAQYGRFRAERSRPFFDLLALVRPRPGARVVDLGCGTSELTRVLHERLGAAETLGIDSSAAMLEKSAALAAAGLRFERADIADLDAKRRWDVVFSNAALHWLPDHEALFAGLGRALADGGQLAVQMPANFDHVSHRAAAAVAAEAPFAALVGGGSHPADHVLSPEAYALLLQRLGFADQHVRLQVYVHRLPARDDVVEWVKGTLLTDYERRLSPDDFREFLARYRARLLAELPDVRPYVYTFKRLLLWAQR